MKQFLATALFCLAIQPAATLATSKVQSKDHHETRIVETRIQYARALRADDRNGFPVYMAAIGGQVVFEGHAPVFATVKLGGQIYTVPGDKEGYFSLFVYTNGYNDFTVEGWSPHEANGPKVQPIAEGTIK